MRFIPASPCLGFEFVKKGSDAHNIPIPGASTVDHVIENGEASDVELNEEDLAEINQMLATGGVARDRYHPSGMKSING